MKNARTQTIATPDGPADIHIGHPDGPEPAPAVILFMDALGVRPALLAMAARLVDHGYYVAVPNLHHRSGPYAPFDAATVWNSEPERNRLMALVRAIDNAGILRDTSAVLDFLAQQPEVRPGPVGCTGYCLGGRAALLAAGGFPDRIAAAASFHGGRLATDAPDSPHLRARAIRAELYIGVAGIDPSFPDEERARLEAALTEAGVRYTLEVYEGAKHGFAVPDGPPHPTAAEQHWERLLAFFARTLGGKAAPAPRS